MNRTIRKIIVHCTATEEGRDFHVDDINRWHKYRGFSKIGYHWLVCIDGSIEQGRDEAEQGAHTKGQNAHSIGVCYVGGLRGGKPCDTRTAAQKQALRRLITDLKRRYAGATVHGHSEFAAKACPCFDARAEYAGI